jgi:prephenate dehydratase
MLKSDFEKMRVAFQGEPGAFSEAAAVQLLGESVRTIPRATFDAAFDAITRGTADALLVPVENTLAGSVVRVYDLLLESKLEICGETILPIEHILIGYPGSTFSDIRSVASHPMALAQCEQFFQTHPALRRIPAEDTAGSVREMMGSRDKSCAAIAGLRAAKHYNAIVLQEKIQDNPENYTRFVLLLPPEQAKLYRPQDAKKMSLAMRLAHRPGSLLNCLQPFARHSVNLLKIESRPIHGRPFEYQFYVDVDADEIGQLESALYEVHNASAELRVLGLYAAAKR